MDARTGCGGRWDVPTALPEAGGGLGQRDAAHAEPARPRVWSRCCGIVALRPPGREGLLERTLPLHFAPFAQTEHSQEGPNPHPRRMDPALDDAALLVP